VKYKIPVDVEAAINRYVQAVGEEGLVGFCVGDVSGEWCTIRTAYKTDEYLSIVRKQPPWGRLNTFLRENKGKGRVIPWIISLSPRDIKTFRYLIESTGNKEALVSIPKLDSSFIYSVDNGLCGIELIEKPEAGGFFAREFAEIYLKTHSKLPGSRIREPRQDS